MKVVDGQIIELDPDKTYVLFVKANSILAKVVEQQGIKRLDGDIIFVGDHSDYRFVENSNRITNVEVEK